MTAKFIGCTSCGFIKNVIYQIYTKLDKNYIWVYDINNHSNRCPYVNMEKILENWDLF